MHRHITCYCDIGVLQRICVVGSVKVHPVPLLCAAAASLKLAGRMAASSAAVAQKLPADPASEAYDLQLQFRVALYQGNDKEMAAIAGRMAVHPGVGPSALYSLVEWCSHKEHK